MLFAAIQPLPADIIPLTAIVLGCGMGLVGMVTHAIRKTLTEKYREESRREIAAYVAEGSISPEDAAKLLSAGRSAMDAFRMAMGK